MEHSLVNKFGAQSIIIAIKPGEELNCIFCSNICESSVLKKFKIPICIECSKKSYSKNYSRNSPDPFFHSPYKINPNILRCEKNMLNFRY